MYSIYNLKNTTFYSLLTSMNSNYMTVTQYDEFTLCKYSSPASDKKGKFEFDKWMAHKRDMVISTSVWYHSILVEATFNLSKNAYSRKNAKQQAAEFKTCVPMKKN